MKFDDLLESYSKQINEQVPTAPNMAPVQQRGPGGLTDKGFNKPGAPNMAVPMPMGKGGSTAVPMPGLSQQNKPQSQFKNTTPMERMKDLWDLLIATQTDDQINVKRILTKYGMTYMPKTTGP